MNRLIAQPPPSAAPCEPITDAEQLRASYAAFLHDESQLHGTWIASLALPRTVEELAATLAWHHSQRHPVTIAGARTGLVGGAVPPEGGHVISLERLTGVVEIHPDDGGNGPHVRVKAGTPLASLRDHLAEQAPDLCFPVNPTEASASIGGMVATNASGSRSLRYGPTRTWVGALRVVLVDGHILSLRRGDVRARQSTFVLERDGQTTELRASTIPKPATKHSIGYSFGPDLDAVDLFVGSEGTLGVIAEVDLRLIHSGAPPLCYLQLFRTEDDAFAFVDWLRDHSQLPVLAIEYFDERSLQLAANTAPGQLARHGALAEAPASAAIYAEIEMGNARAQEHTIDCIEGALARTATPSEWSSAATDSAGIREMQAFRHAVPEQINALIAQRRHRVPGLHKIATDMAVPARHLRTIVERYRRDLNALKLDYAIFGHIGDSHLHVNILPIALEQLAQAKQAYRSLAREVVRLGGAVSAEHGIGRLKQAFLPIQYGPEHLDAMRQIKRFFDPKNLLNPGVLLPPHP